MELPASAHPDKKRPHPKRCGPKKYGALARIYAGAPAASVDTFLDRTGIQTLGVDIAIDEFDHCNRRGIAVTVSQP